MTTNELQQANNSETADSQIDVAETPGALSLEELGNRQQAAMATLKETTSELDTLLENTVGAVGENVSQSKKMTDEVKNQAAEKAAAVLEEAKAQAQEIISDADKERRSQAREAVMKVGELIEAARSSAGGVAKPDWEKLQFTGEIRSALEASIENSLQSVLKDLQDLRQQTKVLEGQDGPQVPDSATFGHSEKDTGSQPTNGLHGTTNETASPTHLNGTNSDADVSQADNDQELGNKELGKGEDAISQLGNSTRVDNAPETMSNGNRNTPVPTADTGSNGPAKESRLYEGNITLVILLKKASDKRTDRMTPDRLSSQITNSQGGSVVHSGMVGKEYLIKAHFQKPVLLQQVLEGVSEWEDFEDQSNKVQEYQNRISEGIPPAPQKESEDERRILVTL